jgi:hypothetical protein
MDNDGEAAAIKTPMIYICGECHRWVSLQNVEVRLIFRSRFVATCFFYRQYRTSLYGFGSARKINF